MRYCNKGFVSWVSSKMVKNIHMKSAFELLYTENYDLALCKIPAHLQVYCSLILIHVSLLFRVEY